MMSYQEKRNSERGFNSKSHICLSSLIIDRRLQLKASDYPVTFGRRARTPAGLPPGRRRYYLTYNSLVRDRYFVAV